MFLWFPPSPHSGLCPRVLIRWVLPWSLEYSVTYLPLPLPSWAWYSPPLSSPFYFSPGQLFTLLESSQPWTEGWVEGKAWWHLEAREWQGLHGWALFQGQRLLLRSVQLEEEDSWNQDSGWWAQRWQEAGLKSKEVWEGAGPDGGQPVPSCVGRTVGAILVQKELL